MNKVDQLAEALWRDAVWGLKKTPSLTWESISEDGRQHWRKRAEEILYRRGRTCGLQLSFEKGQVPTMTSRESERSTAREVFENRVSTLEGTIRHQAQNKLKALQDLAVADEALNNRVMELVTYLKAQNKNLRDEAEIKEDKLKAANIENTELINTITSLERLLAEAAQRDHEEQLAADKLEGLVTAWLDTKQPLATLSDYIRTHWNDKKAETPTLAGQVASSISDALSAPLSSLSEAMKGLLATGQLPKVEKPSEPYSAADDAVAQFETEDPETEFVSTVFGPGGKLYTSFRKESPYEDEGYKYRIGDEVNTGDPTHETLRVIDRSNAHGICYLLQPVGGAKPFWVDAEDMAQWDKSTTPEAERPVLKIRLADGKIVDGVVTATGSIEISPAAAADISGLAECKLAPEDVKPAPETTASSLKERLAAWTPPLPEKLLSGEAEGWFYMISLNGGADVLQCPGDWDVATLHLKNIRATGLFGDKDGGVPWLIGAYRKPDVNEDVPRSFGYTPTLTGRITQDYTEWARIAPRLDTPVLPKRFKLGDWVEWTLGGEVRFGQVEGVFAQGYDVNTAPDSTHSGGTIFVNAQDAKPTDAPAPDRKFQEGDQVLVAKSGLRIYTVVGYDETAEQYQLLPLGFRRSTFTRFGILRDEDQITIYRAKGAQ